MGPLGQVKPGSQSLPHSRARALPFTFHLSPFTVSPLTRLTPGGALAPRLRHFHRVQGGGQLIFR
jgi:hypothetical protein